MAEEKKPYPSRVKKKSQSSTNTMLNVMIGLVFSLILIVGAFIFLGQTNSADNSGDSESVQISNDSQSETDEEEDEDVAGGLPEDREEDSGSQDEQTSERDQTEEEADSAAEEQESDDTADAEASEESDENADAESGEESDGEQGSVTGGTITRQESNDPIVRESIINTSWEPVGTSQNGEHVSVYDTNSVDWKEKIDAITYATGLSEEDMFIMYIGNGGGPQRSVGTVQSKDLSEKYRVYLEWVEKEGWKPVKMDILNTVEGAY